MSIISVTFVPEGIAMSADSRLTASKDCGNGRIEIYTLTDNAQKLFLIQNKRVGISWCGNAFIQNKTIADFLRIFEIEEIGNDDNVISIVEKLHNYLKKFPDGNRSSFYVCGFSDDAPYVYVLGSDFCERKNIFANGQIKYNSCWNGDYEAIDRLIIGKKETEIDYNRMPLKDAIDFSEFLVELVIKYQRFEAKVSTCGGSIDVLVVTKDYAKFIKHKILNP
jgi:hypothetical protein